ncbi:MAG: hypothetical protein EXR71_08705 [Myxococcales bacterium]|nr:hypothetical protein [Myxococcales bacterium]
MLAVIALGLAAAPTAFYDLGFIHAGAGAFAGGVGAPSVEWDGENERLVMYFESPSPAVDLPEGCTTAFRIGRATSTDGVTWTADEEPTFSFTGEATSPRQCSVAQPAVVFDGTRWNLFYSASSLPPEADGVNAPTGIGWATSVDGVSFTVQTETLVAFETSSIGLASAAVLNGVLLLAYTEHPNVMLISRAVAGGQWSAPTLMLDHDAVGPWATNWVHGPSLACDELDAEPLSVVFGGDTLPPFTRSLAVAGSANGTSWAVSPGSPLSAGTLDYGLLNHWDVLHAGDGWAMWYSQTDPGSGLKTIGAAVTDTQLGPPRPRTCPDPWALPEDTGDTADTGEVDSGDRAAGDTDCMCAASGCGCSSSSGVVPAAASVWVLAALLRRGRRR